MTLEFKSLPLQGPLIDNLTKSGFLTLTPIQEKTIPVVLSGQDVFGQAATGTGKTGAYLVPLISRVLATRAAGSGMPSTESTATESKLPEPKLPESKAAGSHAAESSQVIDPQAASEPLALLPVEGAMPAAPAPITGWHSKSLILVMVPTRELSDQVAESFRKFSDGLNMKGVIIYGGVGYEDQVRELKTPTAHFIFATPGRLIDLYKEHEIDLKQVRAIVFDEADRLFDMGFRDDMKFILSRVPRDRQLLVFSATLNFEVQEVCYKFGASPVEVALDRERVKPPKLHDFIVHAGSEEKAKYIFSLLKKYNPESAIVFTNFKNQVEALAEFLTRNGYAALGISSLLSQQQRNRVMHQFKNEKQIRVLVATDVGSRGLDIHGVDLVVNFELPQDSESYVHRIGRTARSGASGTAISLVGHEDVESLERIHKYLGQTIETLWLDDKELIEPELSWEKIRRQAYRASQAERGSEQGHRGSRQGSRGPGREGGPRSQQGRSPQRSSEGHSHSRDRNSDRGEQRGGPRHEGRTDGRSGQRGDHRSDHLADQRQDRSMGPRREGAGSQQELGSHRNRPASGNRRSGARGPSRDMQSRDSQRDSQSRKRHSDSNFRRNRSGASASNRGPKSGAAKSAKRGWLSRSISALKSQIKSIFK